MGWSQWERVREDEFKEVILEKKYHDELGGGIARIMLNHGKMNTLTKNNMDELFHCFYDANHDPNVGVIVLTGQGQNFGAGGDVGWEEKHLLEQMYWRKPVNELVTNSRKPVIAQIRGWCIGGHNHFAYMCDMTIASETAKFGQNGPKISSPVDGYIVAYLTRVVGAKKAREMWMLCRKYNAQEALAMGLVNTVVPDDQLEDEVDKWCEDLLSLNPECAEILKASFEMEYDYMKSTCARIQDHLYPDFFNSPGQMEGPRAFMEKRKPRFWKIKRQLADRKKAAEKEIADELGLKPGH